MRGWHWSRQLNDTVALSLTLYCRIVGHYRFPRTETISFTRCVRRFGFSTRVVCVYDIPRHRCRRVRGSAWGNARAIAMYVARVPRRLARVLQNRECWQRVRPLLCELLIGTKIERYRTSFNLDYVLNVKTGRAPRISISWPGVH